MSTASNAPSAVMAGSLLQLAPKAPNSLSPAESRPDHAKLGAEYWAHLQRLPHMPQPPPGMFAGFMGFNLFLDETLEPDVMELRNKDGKVLETFRLKP